MKRLIIIAMIGFVLNDCHNPNTDFVVDLSTQEGYGPFMPSQRIVGPSQDSLIFTNVPEVIDEYVVRNFNLPPEQKILMLIGSIKDKRVIMIDSDNDKDFGNEKILEYEYPLSIEEQKEIAESLPAISSKVEYVENGQAIIRNIKIRPTPYTGPLTMSFNTDNEVEKKYYLFASVPEYKKGKLKIRDSELNVYISNSFIRMDYLKEYVSILIAPQTQAMLQSKDNIPYTIGDIFNVNGYDYLIDSISKWGDKLFIKYIEKNERPAGISVGYYLPKFEAKYLDGTVFDIAKYSGKYILLDFWGTWCVPCIELIPELKKMNSDFSDKNFELISVAFDDNPAKVTDFVVKEDMSWSHLFVSTSQNDDNSVINKLKISKYPTTILISPEGKIIGRDLTMDELFGIMNEI